MSCLESKMKVSPLTPTLWSSPMPGTLVLRTQAPAMTLRSTDETGFPGILVLLSTGFPCLGLEWRLTGWVFRSDSISGYGNSRHFK